MTITGSLTDYLDLLLQKIAFEKKEAILLGDFNINLLNCDSDKDTSSFLEMMLSNSLLPRITKPTRITTRLKTLIDNIFFSELQNDIVAGNITNDISNHLAQFVAIPNQGSSIFSEGLDKDIYRRNFNKINFNKFIEDFQIIDWETLFSLSNVNDAYYSFLKETDTLIEKHIPFEKISKRKLKQQPRKPWINNELMKRVNHKNKLHKRSKLEINNNLKTKLNHEWQILQKAVKKDIQIEKDKYYQNFFKQNKNNLTKVWKTIKSLINFKPNKVSNLINLNINGEISSNPLEVANHFNKYFPTIASKIDKKIIKSNKKFTDFLINPNEKPFSLHLTTPQEVQDYLKNIDLRKSVGPFSIPSRLLKEFSKLFSIPICKIFHLSIEHCTFPEKMKIAMVIPVYKIKESIFECNNYRPIETRLSKFLESNKCLFPNQFGFRNKYSTTHALIDITETIQKAIDNGEFACGVFLDLQKAFDTVNHTILLKKLEHDGVRGDALK